MRRRTERGAIAPMVAVLMPLLLVVAALAVDLGQQRVVRRDLQALADVVAMDLARLMGDRTESQLEALEQGRINQTKAANSAPLGSPVTVEAEWGQIVPATGTFAQVGASEYPTAVRVTASGSVDFAFRPGSGGATRTALATADKSGCLRVGSFAVRVSSGDASAIRLVNGLLRAVLGVDLLSTNPAIDLLSYRGLARAKITLLDLVEVGDLGVGTVDELLALQNLNIGRLTAATLKVLNRRPPADTAAVTLLSAINAKIGPIASTPINLGQLLGLQQGSESALRVGLNALDLVMATVLVADAQNSVRIQDLGLNLGSLAGVTGTLKLVEKPQWRCGRVNQTVAQSAQATLDLRGGVSLPALSILGLADLEVTAGQVGLTVTLAEASATLRDVQCASAVPGSTDKLKADVQSGLVSVNVAIPLVLKADVLGFLVKVEVRAAVRLRSASASQTHQGVELVLPTNSSTPKSPGSGAVGLSGLTLSVTDATDPSRDATVEVRILGLGGELPMPVGELLTRIGTAVSGALQPVLGVVETALVGPLSGLLGLKLGGADVLGDGAVCNNAALRG